jgi:uncharacterized protein (TIGR02265 family)
VSFERVKQRLAFDSSVEALFVKLLGPRLGDEGRTKLRLAGLDLNLKLLPAYPAEDVARWIDVCMPFAYPGLSRDAAIHELGRESVESYGQTTLGKALIVGVRLMGLRRVLERMTRSMRSGGNYLSSEYRELGPRDLELEVNDHNTMPTFYTGMFEAIARVCGVEGAQVELLPVTGPGCTVRVRWSE